MTASRSSHSTSSNGWTPCFVKYRSIVSPFGVTERSRSLVATDIPFLAARKDVTTLELHPEDSAPRHRGCQGAQTQHRAALTVSHHYTLWFVPLPAKGSAGPMGISRGTGWGLPVNNLGPGAPGLRRHALLQQHPELTLEVRQLLKVLVHAGESHVSHVIELLQLCEDLQAHVL